MKQKHHCGCVTEGGDDCICIHPCDYHKKKGTFLWVAFTYGKKRNQTFGRNK